MSAFTGFYTACLRAAQTTLLHKRCQCQLYVHVQIALSPWLVRQHVHHSYIYQRPQTHGLFLNPYKISFMSEPH